MYSTPGINSYEEMLRHPEKEIIDFEFLMTHPEYKAAVWLRYETDIAFQSRLDQIMSVNLYFKSRFNHCFEDFITKRGR